VRSLFLVGAMLGCWNNNNSAVPSGVAASRATTTTLTSSFAIPGERFEYNVSLLGLQVGLLRSAVGSLGEIEGRPAVIVRSRGSSSGVLALVFSELTYDLETTLVVGRSVPVRTVEESRVELDGEVLHHEREEREDEIIRHDLHSFICALRDWRSRVGDRAEFRLRVGGLNVKGTVWDARREYRASSHVDAIRYDGIAHESYPFTVWISDDAARAPIAVQASTKWGVVVVELVSYDVEDVAP
jgi:hypothetical protein